jgi:hypothetical protein
MIPNRREVGMSAKQGASMVEDRPLVKDQPGTIPEAETGTTEGGGGDIRCPLCGWTPAAEDRWMCRCRHSWNTFDTGGVCPGCLFQWANTQCLACHGWSLHSDWYPKASS